MIGYTEVREIQNHGDVVIVAATLARAYASARREWFMVGIPDANAVAARIEHLEGLCREHGSTVAESGGVRVERRGDRYFVGVDKKLQQLLCSSRFRNYYAGRKA